MLFQGNDFWKILEKVLNTHRHYCNIACRWTHHIRYTTVPHCNTGLSCTIFFFRTATFFPLIIFSSTVQVQRKTRWYAKKVFSIYRMFMLWLKLPTGRGSLVLIPLNSSFRTQQGTLPDFGLETVRLVFTPPFVLKKLKNGINLLYYPSNIFQRTT